jgi:hypothetical protein
MAPAGHPPISRCGAASATRAATGENVDAFPPERAKFVRFTILATNSAEPCLDELEVLSVDGDNVARRATPTSSGDFQNNDFHKLAHVNDGLYANRRSWIASRISGGWVQLELPEVTEVSRVVWSRDRSPKPEYVDRLPTQYEIAVSLDGTTWKTVARHVDRLPPDYVHAGSIGPIVAGAELSPNEAAELETLKANVAAARRLLDWLASELVDPADRWRLKRLQRLIVTSRAYRQASTARDDGLAADAAARLVWRYPPRRLEAEPLRDAILAVSGSLVNEPGGPGDRDRLRPAGQGGGGRGGPRGESGTMTSELLPRLGELADEMCFIHSMTTKSNTHGPAESQMATGFTLDGFPSIGAWTTYALGSECRDLPAFVAIPDPRRRAADRAAAVAERLPARLLPGHALQR